MSLGGVGAVASSTSNTTTAATEMGLDDDKIAGTSSEEKNLETHNNEGDGDEVDELGRQMSGASVEDDDEEETEGSNIQLGPQCHLKEHLEKDKDDESLRKWKEQLLGTVDFENIGETVEPEVKILSLSIISPERNNIVLQIPEDGKPKGCWFTLKEGSHYNLMFTFKVSNNIVSGLKYINTVWKTGVKVDSAKEMLGTFSPQAEPYTHVMPEETTPSGMFARGSYSAKSKFLDDDNKCYLEINYTFDIRKEWSAT